MPGFLTRRSKAALSCAVTRFRRLRRLVWVWLCLVVVLAGLFGFLRAYAICGPMTATIALDSLYRAFQLFGLNFDLPLCTGAAADTARPQLNGWLHAARILAFVVAFSTVIRVFFSDAWNNGALWLQATFLYRNRVLLLGMGQINGAVAIALKGRAPYPPITAVDRNFADADRRLARDLGIRLVEGELSDSHTLQRVRADRAKQVYVAMGDDILTIDVATMVAPLVESGIARRTPDDGTRTRKRRAGQTLQGHWPLSAHISDTALLAKMIDARDVSGQTDAGFHPFNLRVEAASAFVYRADLVQRARDHGQDRVHLVIVGLGHQGEAILTETLLTSYAADLLPPRITVLDRQAEAARTRMQAIYPELMTGGVAAIRDAGSPRCEGWTPITFHAFDTADVDFTRDAMLASLDGRDVVGWPTAWVFSCGDDRTNLAAALRLEVAMQHRVRRAVPIFVRLWGSGLQSPAMGRRNLFGLTEYFGSSVETVQSSRYFHDGGDDLARAIHAAYQSTDHSGGNGSAASAAAERFRQDWLDLPENMREGNRRPARHLGFKFRDLGFDWRGFRKGVMPALPPDRASVLRARIAVIRSNAADAAKTEKAGHPPLFEEADAPLRDAAQVEHAMWSVDRVSKGWRQSPTGIRNNIYRHHICLHPFSELSPVDQANDLVALGAGLAADSAGAPAAHARKVVRMNLHEAATPDLTGCTQLDLLVDPSQPLAAGRTGQIATTISGWASGDATTAVRLQVILEAPVVLPPDRDWKHNDSRVIKALTEALAGLPDDLIVDVTRRYAPLPPPSPSDAGAGTPPA